MDESKRVKIQNFIESQIPEFLNEDNPIFKEFLEQYYISQEHYTGTTDIVNNFLEYTSIDKFNNETFYTQLIPCILQEEIQTFSSTILVNHTIGFPNKYGLLKINDEIITYTSKTNVSFEGCIRGFSGIDKISSKSFTPEFNFEVTNSQIHQKDSEIVNLSVKFFDELFRKFRYQFIPGFENRKFADKLDLQSTLLRAKDFYTSKGTDISYKLLFKILFNEEVELIKPQDYMLRPSDNKYFITKNILVEKIDGDLDPLSLLGETIFQETPFGLASAAIYNIEFRPIGNKFLYEISLDPSSVVLDFIPTKKTKVLVGVSKTESSITVDSTVGFPKSGELLVQSQNSLAQFNITYKDKTLTQFLDVTGNIIDLFKSDTLIENNFAYISILNQVVRLRIINIINDIDYSDTSSLRVDDIINLSSFGKELSDRPEFSSWIYNIPTTHKINLISSTAEENIWRLELLDSVKFTVDEAIVLTDSLTNASFNTNVRRIINNKIIEVNGGTEILNKDLLSKILTKSNVFNYPDANKLNSNIQNVYTDKENSSIYVASSGLPEYTIIANNRSVDISTIPNPDPFSGIGGTTLISTNIVHNFYTGEKIFFTPTNNTGLSTGVYFVSAIGNFSSSKELSFSFSDSDLFSKKYIKVPYNTTGNIVKIDYENKDIEHQKLLKKIPIFKPNYTIDDTIDRSTNNRPIGLLVNGVELYSSTLYDENIYYGKLDNIQILSGGDGYDVINSPQLQISDVIEKTTYGFGAKAHLNITGSLKGISIINPGSDYDNNLKISITGGNGINAKIEPNVAKTRILSGFRGDGQGINPTDNSIRFVFPHNFEDGEVIEYFSNNNVEIEYFDPISQEIRKLPSNSFYFAGVFSDTIIKLYRTKEDAAKKINEIDLTTSPSFGFHYFRSLESKYSLIDVYIRDGGINYSNKKVIIPAIGNNNDNQNGINIVDGYIFAKSHNFNDKDLIVYTTTETPISGISTESKYHVKVLDKNRFKLSFAGVGKDISDENYIKERYIRFSTVGTGKHTFSYPPIELEIEAYPESANGKLKLPILEPILTGKPDSVFIEEYGEKYGTDNVINFHRRPLVSISEITSEALFKPIVVNGSIIEVQILNFGNGYGKDVDLVIDGPGNFAKLYPIITNGRVTSVIVLNGGVGYTNTTSVRIVRRGSGAKFLGNVFEWKINQIVKNNSILNNTDEGILVPSKNIQTGLQFIQFYPPKILRKKLNDNIDIQNKEVIEPTPSPILGWSYDGFPIYGPYTNVDNEIRPIRNSYRQIVNRNRNLRPTGNDFPDGFFIQDFIFDIEFGDGLDEYNGKYVKNSDFPEGTYAYFFTIDIDNNRNTIPRYPYVISTEFNRPVELKNYDPNYNQDLDLNTLNLIRNVSPYYLNSTTSYYELIDDVDSKYKQEFNVRTISTSGIDDIDIYNSGDDYSVGDILKFENKDTGGIGANAVVSSIQGKSISSIDIGVSTIFSTRFSKIGSLITGISDEPLDFINSELVEISSVSNTLYKFLEGVKTVNVFTKKVGITTDIKNISETGNITEIFPNDISEFEVGDYIKIDNESLKIIQIIPRDNKFIVERLNNVGIHSSGISEVELLPRKFRFFDTTSKLLLIENITTYFSPDDVISFGEESRQYEISGVSTITIPEKSIYIPNHSYQTGQPLTYNSGINGTPLLVYNSPGEVSFSLVDNQTLYAVNFGKDFVGISTIGFSSSIGIGSTYSSLYFDSSISGVGAAHSLTTQYAEVFASVENYSVIISTEINHDLNTGDIINLNITPEITEIVKFRYDPVIQKITTDLIEFDAETVDTETSEVEIVSNELNTGDKIVYYSNNASPIGGLENNKSYFIIKEDFKKIKFAEYYSDAILGIYITLTSGGSGVQSIAKINPPIEITKGNTILFDTSDESLIDLKLRLYRDIDFKIELETYNYVLPSGDRYLRTSIPIYPNEVYYSFCSISNPICSDFDVKNNNFIKISGSDYNKDYTIIKLDENRFKFNLQGRPENVEYTKDKLSELKYSTQVQTVRGPINKIKINYGGRGYKKIPKISRIISKFGKNAVLKAKSNKIGRISSVDRVKDGFDYPTDTTLLPLLSVPAVVQVEDISRVDFVGILTGGKNYNTPPTLKVLGNDRIKLEAVLQGSSIVDVKIIENTDDLPGPLKIIPTRNSNGYNIDDIEVNGTQVTLELLNSDNQLYPLISTGYGSTEVVFPFEIGDQIFIERCRIFLSERDANNILIQKDNYNSSNYNYRFFTVTGISSENYTVTYSMEGAKDNLNLGEYTADFGYGVVVNKKDLADFEMFIANDLNYVSEEIVLGFNGRGTNTFSAKVMKNGWDNDINELRLIDVKGELKLGNKLKGLVSQLNGTVTNVNIFNLKSTVGVSREKLNDLGDRVGFTNDSYQRISDNNYYQKFSYSIKGRLPYNVWKEPVRALIHPSGFKEFSDLSIESSSNATMKVGTASSLDLLVNIDNVQSLYKRNNFGMVTEDEQFEDGSIERVIFEEGVVLRPYILSKSNKVVNLDDISSQFDGTAILQVIANKPVTFISTDIYRLGVSTDGLNVGDKIGFSTYHFYPDSTYIFDIGNNYVELSQDTPHKLYSIGGNAVSVTESLDFLRRVPGCKVVGTSNFKLTNDGTSVFYREFDASNGITTSINLINDTFILPNHNFQTGQKLIYTPEIQSIAAIAVTDVGSGALLEPTFDENYSVTRIKVINGGSGYDPINLPKIEIIGTETPLELGEFIPQVENISGIITSIQIGVGNSGFGYFPISSGTVGIATTSEVEGRKDIIMEVGGGIGGAIYERGYNVSITTSIIGISSGIEPNFSGQQNRFWGFLEPYIPAKESTGDGIDAKFSIFIVYNSSTGQPISTSVVLRDGGRGYSVGDTVSIAGTNMGGETPDNDLSFVVSKVSSTRISLEANGNYFNIPSDTSVGYGSGAIFNISRDDLGDVSRVTAVTGGKNYSLTDNISIAGTFIGGITPEDNLFLSPTVLGVDKLPTNLYGV
jgi:hypothetical protein